ncbi:MAG: glutathione S-transferase family protein [Alphaproteobacteria bacterium]
MKLYNSNLSPYTARVRLLCNVKGLNIEYVDPPGFRTDAYRKINPIGKIPALELDDGTVLPESEVICEYLEDMFPTPTLRPTDAHDRAQARLIARMSDLYIMPAVRPLVFKLFGREISPQAVTEAIPNLNAALKDLEALIGEGGYAAAKQLTHADGALAASLMFVTAILPRFDVPKPLEGYPKVAAYWTAISKDKHIAKILGEMQEGIKKAFGG